MNIKRAGNSFVDSVYYLDGGKYEIGRAYHFLGALSVHDHIILNDGCASITLYIDGKEYTFDGNVVCGKFTKIPKMKIIFKDPGKKLTIIQLVPCGMFRLSGISMETMVNSAFDGAVLDMQIRSGEDLENYIQRMDAHMRSKNSDTSFQVIQSIIQDIHTNFVHLPSNASKSIAENFDLSQSTVRRYFKKYLGINLSTYIITLKRKRMIQSIYEDRYDSVSIHENGYYDQSHFLNDFKRMYGVSFKHYFNELETIRQTSPALMYLLHHCNVSPAYSKGVE